MSNLVQVQWQVHNLTYYSAVLSALFEMTMPLLKFKDLKKTVIVVAYLAGQRHAVATNKSNYVNWCHRHMAL